MLSLTGKTRRNRKYILEEKAVFFEALERTGRVAGAAQEAGIASMIGYQRARKAGVDTTRFARERRENYRRLRADGVHQSEAARRVGVDIRTARDWDQGIRRSQNRRIYPDGRVIDYNSAMTTVLAPASTTAAAVEAVFDPRYLSLPEREKVRDLTAAGASRCRGTSAPGEGSEATRTDKVASVRAGQAAHPLVTRTDLPRFGQGTSDRCGDACVTRDRGPRSAGALGRRSHHRGPEQVGDRHLGGAHHPVCDVGASARRAQR